MQKKETIKTLARILLSSVLSFLFALTVSSFTSCKANSSEPENDRFEVVDTIRGNMHATLVVVDHETGCQYILSNESGICLLVDSDGNPLIYGGNK